MKTIKTFLPPPTYTDEETTRVAGLLHIILQAAILILTIYTILAFFLYPFSIFIILLPLNLIKIILAVVGLYLIRRGLIRFTSILLAATYWTTITLSAFLLGGGSSAILSAFILAILFASIALNSRAVLIFAILSVFAGWGLFIAQGNGLLPLPLQTLAPSSIWLIQTAQIILIALLLYLSNHSLQNALARAYKNEREVAEINDALQQEISKRVRAIGAQKHSLSLLQATLESTADGILVVNTKGEITSFNQKFVEMWHIPEDIIARRDDGAALEFVMNQLKDPESFLSNVRHLYDRLDEESFDILQFTDGRIYERYSRPQQIGGQTVGRVWSFRDVTKQRQAAEALRQNARRLETLQSVTTALATSLALDELLDIILEQLAVVLPYDSASIFLLEEDALLAVAGRGLPHPEQVIGHKFSLDNALCRLMLEKQESIWLADAQLDPRFERWGEATYIRGWLSVPLFASGHFIGFMSIDSQKPNTYGSEQAKLVVPFAAQAAQAIENARLHKQIQQHAADLEVRVAQRTHELHEAQEKLVRREKLAVMGQMAGGIAHELRNPLAAIKNAAYALDMLLEKKNSDAEEMLAVLQTEVNTAEQIIKTLLNYARSRPPFFEPVDLNGLLARVLASTAVPDHIQIATHLAADLPLIPADSGQLMQLFNNIIQNSFQAMAEPHPSGKKHCLTIQTAVKDPDWVSITVADTGPGIPKENLDKLFEPLFTTKPRGIGLGLTLVKTFVEGHGGTIAIYSEGGQGTEFKIQLPTSSQPTDNLESTGEQLV